MKLIENWRDFWRMYSVWCFVALVLVSVADVLLSLYRPKTVMEAVFTGIGTAVLGLLGIFLRVVKQENRKHGKVKSK